MGARELYVEHRYKGRFVRAIRLNRKRNRFVLGSGESSDLRLTGNEISGIHAAFLREHDGWKIIDLGSESGFTVDGKKALETNLERDSTIKLGEHELRVMPRREVVPLFKEDRKKSGALTGQEVVLIFENQIEECYLLSATEPFKYHYDGKDIILEAPKTDAWTITDYGPFQVRQRLCPLPEQIGKDSMTLDKDLFRALAMTLALVLIMMPVLSLIQYFKTEKPQETKVAQMIYDAKIIQKKRKKSVEVKSQMTSQAGGPSMQPDKPASQVRVGKATVSTKVISNIKASGLSQLIGKIAVRAGNTKVAITSDGNISNNDNARGVVSGSTIKDKFESNVSSGYKVSGIATGGKAGGAKGYQAGTGMAVGNVGSGEVGLIDEESVIDGGLDREVIAAVIKESLGQIRYCYERHLSADPNLNGKVQVKFTIGAAGTVTTQEIGATTLKNAMVEGCILRRVARWKFPQPKGGTSVMVTYPFLFKALN